MIERNLKKEAFIKTPLFNTIFNEHPNKKLEGLLKFFI